MLETLCFLQCALELTITDYLQKIKEHVCVFLVLPVLQTLGSGHRDGNFCLKGVCSQHLTFQLSG